MEGKMTRFHVLQRQEMNAEQRQLCDEIEATDGRLRGGPYWAYIRNPKFMRLHNDMSRYFRSCPLTGRERQIAVLAVVRYWNARYPWAVQVRASLAVGVEQEIIDAINARQRPNFSAPGEAAAYDVASELVADKGLSDATYAAAEQQFGLEKLVDLVSSIGFFSMVCCTANAFDITPPDDAPARLID
jgi:4-carboxymuconolactone decarboxylase